MAAEAATLLVCGFGPFPGFAANPSESVVERLQAENWSPADAQARYGVLPTTWTGAPATLRSRIDESGAQGVLLTGVAASASAFRVELRAKNRTSVEHPDAAGVVRTAPAIAPLGPAALRSTAPVEAMLAALRAAGLPAEPSSDAGDYLCNFTLYALLADRLDSPAACPLGFLHLPPEGAGGLGLDDLARGVKAAAGVMARALAFAPHP